MSASYKKNTELNIREYHEGLLELESRPSVIDLGLTIKCNLNCVMCFSRLMPQNDMDPEVVEKLIPYLPFAHTIRWNDAGEIFASNRTPEFVELMKAHRPAIGYISTNFLLVHRWLGDIFDSGLTDISASIDAATKETFEAIRQGAKWDRLLKNLELFNQQKAEKGGDLPRLSMVFVAMKSNIQELPEFVEFAHRHGAIAVHVLKMLPTPKRLERTEQPAPGEELEHYRLALQKARELGLILEHTFFNNQTLLEEEARKAAADKPAPTESTPETCEAEPPSMPFEPLHRRDPFRGVSIPICSAPWRELLVQTDGKVRTCCYSPRILGDLKTQSVAEIWNGPGFQEFRRQLLVRDFSDCKDCPFLAKVHSVRQDPFSQTMDRLTEQVRHTAAQAAALDEQRKVFRGHLRGVLRKPPEGSSRLAELSLAIRSFRLLRGHGWRKHKVQRKVAQEQQGQLQQLINLLRISMERQDRGKEDVQLLTEAVQLLGGQLAQTRSRLHGVELPPSANDDPARTLDERLNALFYSAHYEAPETPTRLSVGERRQVPVRVMNTSATPWPTRGRPAVYLAYSWFDERGNLHQLDGERTPLPVSAPPFKPLEVDAALRAPDSPGRYILKWDLVNEDLAWFRDKGCPPLEVHIEVDA